jgi:hypothetical protein
MNTNYILLAGLIILIMIDISLFMRTSSVFNKLDYTNAEVAKNTTSINNNITSIQNSNTTNTSGTWKVGLTAPTGSSINDGYVCNYMRVNDTVYVSGRFDLVTRNAPSVLKVTVEGLPVDAKVIDAAAQVDGFVNSTNAGSYGGIRFDKVTKGDDTDPSKITMTLNKVPANQTGSYLFSWMYQV